MLPDDRYEDWATSLRERLSLLAQELRHTLALLHEAAGDYREAAACLEAVVIADPFDEAAHAGLMRLYALLGDRSHALRQFGQLRDRCFAMLAD